MKEYTGRLVGGPDDGNIVTSPLAVIPVTSTTEIWLDGKGDDKTVSIVVLKGNYLWDAAESLFIWQATSNRIFTKKAELV